MSDTAVITGDFCTFRHVQGRKVLQIVIEVPAEAAGSVFARLGMPGSGEGIPVAVARLNAAPDPIAKPEATKERRPFSELPYAQQAAMLGQEPEFHEFLRTKTGNAGSWRGDKPVSEIAAMTVRYLCEVKSRKDLIAGTPAGDAWQTLEAEYYAWSRGMR